MSYILSSQRSSSLNQLHAQESKLVEKMVAPPSLSIMIKRDHQAIYKYYDEYTLSIGDKDAQERWAHQLTWAIASHSIAEEVIVYPLFEKHLGMQGVEMSDQDRAAHQAVKDMLLSLESFTPGSVDHAHLLKNVMHQVRTHITGEELDELPLLESKLGPRASADAAALFSRTKMFGPTRKV